MTEDRTIVDNKPLALSRPGDLQRRLLAAQDRMDPALFDSAYEAVSFGRLTADEKIALLVAEGAVTPEEPAGATESGDTV